jgi:hypothetical protein
MLQRLLLAAALLFSMALAVPLAYAQEGDDGDGAEGRSGRYCRTSETEADATVDAGDEDDTAKRHPVASRIAERYDLEYEDVIGWFCLGVENEDGDSERNGFGLGQIMLALETARKAGGEPEEYLARRAAGEGWGVIWKDLGIKGGKGGGPPWATVSGEDDEAETTTRTGGPPPWAGGPKKLGSGETDATTTTRQGGPPAWAGPKKTGSQTQGGDAWTPGSGPPPWAGNGKGKGNGQGD